MIIVIFRAMMANGYLIPCVAGLIMNRRSKEQYGGSFLSQTANEAVRSQQPRFKTNLN